MQRCEFEACVYSCRENKNEKEAPFESKDRESIRLLFNFHYNVQATERAENNKNGTFHTSPLHHGSGGPFLAFQWCPCNIITIGNSTAPSPGGSRNRIGQLSTRSRSRSSPTTGIVKRTTRKRTNLQWSSKTTKLAKQRSTPNHGRPLFGIRYPLRGFVLWNTATTTDSHCRYRQFPNGLSLQRMHRLWSQLLPCGATL